MADVKGTIDRSAEIVRAIQELARTRVLVGIPQEKTARRDTTRATNALLGYVHEMGSPANNVPARPWLVPGIQQGMPDIKRALQAIGKAAIEGRERAVEQGFHAVGLIAQNAVRARIRSNIPPPLKPATIAARRRRSKGSSYRRKATTASDVTALIDTAQFLNSTGYVIRKT